MTCPRVSGREETERGLEPSLLMAAHLSRSPVAFRGSRGGFPWARAHLCSPLGVFPPLPSPSSDIGNGHSKIPLSSWRSSSWASGLLGPLALGLPSSGSTSDKEAQGAGFQGNTLVRHLEWYSVGPGGCWGWQALCGLGPGFQGAKAKAGQEFLALIFCL